MPAKLHFEPFIPALAQQLQDADAIAFLKALKRQPIAIPGLVHDSDRVMSQGHCSVAVPTAVMTTDKLETSDAAPLMLLHGFDSSGLEFRHLIPCLALSNIIYTVDLLGSGFTAYLRPVAITPATIRQHLHATWQQLIDRPVVLLGASMGGAVAIDFALSYPDCVERLILIDSVGFSGSFALGQYLNTSLLDWGTDWLRFRKEAALRALAMLPFTDSRLRDTVLCAMLHQAMPGWKEAIASFTRSGGYGYLAQHIAAVQQPTLIMWGDSRSERLRQRDRTLGTADAWKFKRAIPHSRLVWIRGADHAPHIDVPKVVAEAIRQELG